MSIAYLGERFDIHTGGVDLTFPHHDDEIAQSEGALGHPAVTTWSTGTTAVSGQKMAKSSGNVWTLDRLEEDGHEPLDFRYLCLTSRYRRQLRFAPDALAAAGKARSRLEPTWPTGATWCGARQGPPAKEWDRRFRDRARRPRLPPGRSPWVRASSVMTPSPRAGKRRRLVLDLDRVLGLGLDAVTAIPADEELPAGAADLFKARRVARERRDWLRANGCATAFTNWASRCRTPARATYLAPPRPLTGPFGPAPFRTGGKPVVAAMVVWAIDLALQAHFPGLGLDGSSLRQQLPDGSMTFSSTKGLPHAAQRVPAGGRSSPSPRRLALGTALPLSPTTPNSAPPGWNESGEAGHHLDGPELRDDQRYRPDDDHLRIRPLGTPGGHRPRGRVCDEDRFGQDRHHHLRHENPVRHPDGTGRSAG